MPRFVGRPQTIGLVTDLPPGTRGASWEHGERIIVRLADVSHVVAPGVEPL